MLIKTGFGLVLCFCNGECYMIDTYVSSFQKKRSQAHINKVLHQVQDEINNYNPVVTTQDYAEYHFNGYVKPGDVIQMPRPLKPIKVVGYSNGVPIHLGTLDTTGTLVIDQNITIYNVPKSYTTTTTAFSIGKAESHTNVYITYDNESIGYNLDSWDAYASNFNQIYSKYNQYRNRFNIVMVTDKTGALDGNITISNIDCKFNDLMIYSNGEVNVGNIYTNTIPGVQKVLRNYSSSGPFYFNNGSKMEFGSGYSVNNTLFNYVDNFTSFTPVSAMVTRGNYIGTIPAVCDTLGINAVQFAVLFDPIVDGEHVCNDLGMIADYDNVAVYYIASRYNAGSYSKTFSNGVTRKWDISIVRKNDVVPELFQFGGDTFNNNINLLPNNGYTNANTREYIGNAFYHHSAKRYGATWTYDGLNNSRYIPPAPENIVQNVSYNGSNFISSKRLSQKVLIEWNEASDETTLPLRLGYCPYQQYWRWNQNYFDEPQYITREEYETDMWKLCFPGYNLNYVNASPNPAVQETGAFIWYKNLTMKNYTIVNKVTEIVNEGIENRQIVIDLKYRRGL